MDIVVVGHGTSPVGKEWGSRIDQSGIVIRMWDWHWQNKPDYGTKYDIGVYEILPSITDVFLHSNRREPSIKYIAYARQAVSEEIARALPRTEMIYQKWRDQAWEMGGRGAGGKTLNLTRGCAAACWALYSIGRGNRVILVGFDNLWHGKCLPLEEAFPRPYIAEYDKQYPRWRKDWYTPGLTTCGTHDIAIELPLLKSLAEQYHVELLRAEDVWINEHAV